MTPSSQESPFLGTVLRVQHVDASLLSENLYEPATLLPAHTHERAFFSLTLAGGYTERHGSRDVEYKLRSVSFHPPDEQHSVSVGSSHVHCLNVEVADEWMERLEDIATVRPKFIPDGGVELAWLGNRLYEQFRSGAGTSSLAVEGILLQMLAVVGDIENGRDTTETLWVARVEDAIRADLGRRLTVSELADRVALHPVYMSRAWQRFRRCSIGEFVNRVRIEEACRRIAAERVSFADLSLDLGFGDQTHFSRVFRKVTGMTPGTYRTALGKRK